MSSGPSPAKQQSSICLLWLVVCKTVRFQLANTVTTVLIIVGPIMVFLIYSATVLFREQQMEQKLPPINMTSGVARYIYYSPGNLVLAGVIEDVVYGLAAKGSQAFYSAEEMDRALSQKGTFGYVGIEFDDGLREINVLPDKVSVALRFPLHLRSNPKLIWKNNAIFKHTNLETDYYNVEGFLSVQAKLSAALILAKKESAILPEVIVQHYPRPKHLKETFSGNSVALAGILFMPYTIAAAYLARVIVMERRQHMRAMLQLLGVRAWIYWLSWFLVGFLILAIPTLFMGLLLKWRFYPLSDTSVVLVFFLVYNLEVLCSAYMISAFFSDTVSVQVAILIVHLLGSLPWRLMLMGYRTTLLRTLFACLFLNSALALGLQELIENENLHMGMSWSRVFTRCKYNINLGIVVLFMLFGSLWRLLVLVYVEQLKSVRTRRWYFPLQPSYWCPRKGRRRFTPEWDLEGQPIVVRARNLEKVFNERSAVSNVSLNFYQDEITVLLGHNDSGKTTLLLLLAGFLEPSSGGVTINGYDLVIEPRKAHQSMCICPQQNVLLDKLKARWHLKFYCRLKGLSRKEASAEADKYLEIGQMEDFASTKVKHLPSGLKRMLLLCCTLCGNSKIILLDEPGTSLDPLLRRDMWDLLRRERMGRCIIMSTHNIHEAEVVADQIVVLCDGQVIGYGTTRFLTHQAATDSFYLLICTKLDDCLVASVTDFLQERFTDIKVQSEYGIYVTYKLPTRHVSQFPRLFLELEQALVELRIQEFSVCAPTLGSVFLRIGEAMREARDRDRKESLSPLASPSPMSSLLNLLPSFDVREDDGRVKCCNQWRAIMERRRLFAWRHRWLYCLIVAMPVIICLLVICFEVFIFIIDFRLTEHSVTDLRVYPTAVLVIESSADDDPIVQQYRRNALAGGATVRGTGGAALADYLLEQMAADQANAQLTLLAGVTVEGGGKPIIAWANNRLEHGSALSLGMVYAALGQEMAHLEIEIVNKPCADTIGQSLAGLSRNSFVEFSLLVFMYLVLATTIFAVLPVLERQSAVQHQQFSSGMSRVTYWLSHLFWDYCLFVAMILSPIVVAAFTSGSALPLTILLLAYGFAVISFTYLISQMSQDLGKMFIIILYINMIGILALFIHPKSADLRYGVLETVLLIHPHYALFCGTQDIIKMDKVLNVYEPRVKTVLSYTYRWTQLHYLMVSGAVYLTLLLLSWVPRRIGYAFKTIKNEKIEPDQKDEDIGVNRIRQRLSLLTTKNYEHFPLILKNVSKRYGSLLAVQSLTLDLNPFECLGLLGRNGAGKSSTFFMIVGMRSITVGNIHIKGYSLRSHPKEGLRHVGFSPREEMLSFYMTGRETLRYWCLVNGIRRSHVRELVRTLADCFGLVLHLDKRVSTYSNGTKRKLMIAMAILAPTLICLDEPTAGVDMHAKYDIWKILESIRQGGRAILLTTHSMEECEFLCTNVGIMDRGSLLCYGSLAHLKNRFSKGIFVKVKVGTTSEMERAREERERINSTELIYRESGSTMGSLRMSLMHLERHRKPQVEGVRKLEEQAISESDIRGDYDLLLQRLEEIFKRDHPYSSVSEKYTYRGMITFCIPNEMIKWSAIFLYMENLKTEIQILYYSVSHTTFEDVFMDFVRKHNQ
ncbi:phospholipid-transporting ATPase ABCA1 [Drosophila elegans]|uniref:phospholipid-transporting ATPase ABCA1 n=1 Tax=Drosophila elegans TaxID=30023 RepID=UPI0007E71290|nr:phospholipid-transporting ATPase ABCA1 [Drosophila elegans]